MKQEIINFQGCNKSQLKRNKNHLKKQRKALKKNLLRRQANQRVDFDLY
jgi:hypothetical protein